jgi:hypothetical protein
MSKANDYSSKIARFMTPHGLTEFTNAQDARALLPHFRIYYVRLHFALAEAVAFTAAFELRREKDGADHVRRTEVNGKKRRTDHGGRPKP